MLSALNCHSWPIFSTKKWQQAYGVVVKAARVACVVRIRMGRIKNHMHVRHIDVSKEVILLRLNGQLSDSLQMTQLLYRVRYICSYVTNNLGYPGNRR